MLQKLINEDTNDGNSNISGVAIKGCVLSPTRELAIQTYKVTKDLARFTSNFGTSKTSKTNNSHNVVLLVGGESMEKQFENLFKSFNNNNQSIKRNDKIVVSTPGRLIHILAEVNNSKNNTGNLLKENINMYECTCTCMHVPIIS